MADDYDTFNRAELIAELRYKENSLREWKIKTEPNEEEKKQAHATIQAELEAVVELLKGKIKKAIVTSGSSSSPPGTSNQQVVQEWTRAQKRQIIAMDVASVGKLAVSNLERWISEVDRVHTLEILNDDNTFANEFTKMVKRQLPSTIYSQLVDSGTKTDSWSELRKYLVENFGSKISIYQHLTKLNDLQLHQGENISTFASKLEEQLYIASLHISKKYKESNSAEISSQQVFKVIGAMLLSIQLRERHPKVYRAMVKGMDKHWTATSLAAEAANYLDRIGPDISQNETYIVQPKKSAKQTSKASKKNSVQHKEREILSLDKLKEKVKDQVCRNFAKNGECKYGNRCFRKHIKESPSYMAASSNQDTRFDGLFSCLESYMIDPSEGSLDARNGQSSLVYVSTTIENKEMGLAIVADGLIDSGSSISIIPEDILTMVQKEQLTPSNIKLKGVNGDSTCNIIGQLKCSIKLGDCVFEDQIIHVGKNGSIPVIIGLNVLSGNDVSSYSVDIKRGKLLITRTNPDRNHEIMLQQNYSFPAQIEMSIEEKFEHLETKGIQLPKDWDENEKKKVVEILYKHRNVFGSDGEELGTYKTPIRIPTKDGECKAVSGNHVPQALEKAVAADIERMLKIGVIELSKDPKGWNSPVFAVKKSDGSVRTVANFKGTLNRCLVDLDPFEMPNIEKLFSKIGMGNKYFAKLDLKNSFWQILIHEQDRHKTSFQWQGRTYQYRKLAFGLTTASQIFSRATSEVLAKVQKDNITTYVDDHLVSARDFESFLNALEALLSALDENGMKLNTRKSIFLDRQAEFLGRIVSSDGYRPNPEYVEGINNIRPPTNKKELRSLIGRLTWIRQFCETRLHEPVRGSTFADLMKDIHQLSKENSPEIWNKKADKQLSRIKKKLSSSPVISFVDFNLPFHLTTDASTVAAGGVLTQTTPEGKIRIVGVTSTTFSETQQRWSPTEREAYAIVFAIKKFDYFLYGRPFICHTDHKSLCYMDRRNFNNSKIRRWQDQLSQYQFVVQYLEGESNVVADMISRPNGLKQKKNIEDHTPAGCFLKSDKSESPIYVPSWVLGNLTDADQEKIQMFTKHDQIEEAKDLCCFLSNGNQLRVDNIEPNLNSTYHEYASEQTRDPFLSKIIMYFMRKAYNKNVKIMDFLPKDDERSLVYQKLEESLFLEAGTNMLLKRTSDGINQYVVPEHQQATFLYKAHDQCNHSGINRTIDNLAKFFWPRKSDDIKAYIDSCIACAKRKGNYGRIPKWSIGHVERGSQPMECLMLDFVHMERSKGKQYILSIICSFSRFYMAFACARNDSQAAVNGLIKVMNTYRVMPKCVSSDRGSHFTGQIYRKFCEEMMINQQLHVPWRPQSSGNVERAHRTLKNALYILCNQRRVQWPDILDEVVSNMNCQKNKSTQVSPFFVVYGRHPSLRFPDFDDTNTRNIDPIGYGMEIGAKIRNISQAVVIASEEADLAMEKRLNGKSSPQLNIGDKVYLLRPQSEEAKRTKNDWIGPYTVTRTNSMVVEIEDSEGTVEWVHRFHLRAVPDRPPRLNYNPPIPDPQILTPEDEDSLSPDDWSGELGSPEIKDNTPNNIPNNTPSGEVPVNTKTTEIMSNSPTEPLVPSPEAIQPVPQVNTDNLRRRRSRIPVRIRKEPARFRDYVRY